MPEIWFYHLERQPLEAVLPRILAAMYARGDRLSVHAKDVKWLELLSQRLWAVEDVSFVPHGFGSDTNAALLPILLCTNEIPANAAPYRFFTDGVEPSDINQAVRVSLFFDGNNNEASANARQWWKIFRGAGHPIKYWKQSEQGRWEDQAVKQAA